MWTVVEKAPPMLERLGLGREPVWSESDQKWYAKSGGTLMAYSRPHKTCGCTARHGVGAPRTGLGDLSDGTLQQAAAALLDALFTNGATTGTMNGVCSTFQGAYNGQAASAQVAQIQVDDEYGPCTQQALQLVLNAAPAAGGGGPAQAAPASAFTGVCQNGQYVAPAGGGGGGGGGGTPGGGGGASTSTSTNPNPMLVGAAVVGTGLLGYAGWRWYKKHRRH